MNARTPIGCKSTGGVMALETVILQKSLPHAIATEEATLSSALVTIFRGKFCNTILPGRTPIQFKSGEVIYNIGDLDRSMFFIQKGFVKVGTLVPDGREIIYDVRKAGDRKSTRLNSSHASTSY